MRSYDFDAEFASPQNASQIDISHPLPLNGRCVPDCAGKSNLTDIADYIEFPKTRGRMVHVALPVTQETDFQFECDGSVPDANGCCFGAAKINIGEDDPCPFYRKGLTCGAANTRAFSGNDRNLAIKPSCHPVLLILLLAQR